MKCGVVASELLMEDTVLRRVQEAKSDERMEDVLDVYQRPYEPQAPGDLCGRAAGGVIFRMRRFDCHPVVRKMCC
jgi:hypothetical protein